MQLHPSDLICFYININININIINQSIYIQISNNIEISRKNNPKKLKNISK